MKTAVSIPDELFRSADELAKKLGLSRSRLYARAVADFVAKHRGGQVTRELDRVYATEESRLDPATRALEARSVAPEEW